MKEYYKSKFLEKSIEGHFDAKDFMDPGERRWLEKIEKTVELNSNLLTDGLSDRYDDLLPNEGNIYKSSIQFMTVIDLISEGPIEGFVDELGRTTTNPLEATYLDDVVIKPTSRVTKKTYARILNAESAAPSVEAQSPINAITFYDGN